MKAVAETLEAARSHLHEKVHRLLEAVETRFAAIQAPQALEWLTDNGSVYTAVETRDFATALNLVPCFTPVQSPESNGISESFVKTFKRDYVRVTPLLKWTLFLGPWVKLEDGRSV